MSSVKLEKHNFILYVSNPSNATSKFKLKYLDLNTALSLIPVRFGPWDLMVVVGSQHYNLRRTNLQHLMDVIHNPHMRDPTSRESDLAVLREMNDGEVYFYFRPVKYDYKPSGGFWCYWHKLPLDLSRYGLFKEVPHYLSSISSKRDKIKFEWIMSQIVPDTVIMPIQTECESLTQIMDLLDAHYNFTPAQMNQFNILNEIHSYRVSCLERVLIAWEIPIDKMEVFYSLFRETHVHGMRYIPRTRLQELADALSINIRLKKHTGKTMTFKAASSTPSEVKTYALGEYDNHYFVLEEVPITKWALDHFEEIHTLKGGKWALIVSRREGKRGPIYKRSNARRMNSWQLIKYLTNDQRLSSPIRGDEPFLSESVHYNAITRRNRIHLSLRYPLTCVKQMKSTPALAPKELKAPHVMYFWFDFESTTEGIYHREYEVACMDINGELLYFNGEGCGKSLLEAIALKVKIARKVHDNVRVVMIAHYLTYDFQFMVKYLILRTDNLMSRSNVKLVKGRYNYGPNQSFQVWLKDSACLITMPLSEFGEAFDLHNPDGSRLEKDVMPYRAMTQKSICLDTIPLSDARSCMEEKDFNLFKKNVFALGLMRQIKNKTNDVLEAHFDHKAYSKHYCIRDVHVLKEGYLKWREMMLSVTSLDIDQKVTLPSLAHRFAKDSRVYDSVVELSGIPRDFIQRCVEGGRTMTRENKMWHVRWDPESGNNEGRLQDFDGRSLYPSAMHLMPGVLQGAPKVLSPSQIKQINDYLKTHKRQDKSILSTFDGYFLRVKVTSIGRSFSFPLLSKIDSKGVRQYVNETGHYYVDRFKLEDLIEFHQINFVVMQGYYFDEGRNDTIKSFMSNLYQERLRHKSEGNRVEKAFKALMNSTYGRTIMKPIEKDLHFVYGKEALQKKLDWFHFCHNGYDIVDSSKDIFLVEIEKSKGTHFAMPQVGAEILSYSKRIMNQVLCLAEDVGAMIYYQDTDSMHIEEDHIEMLRDAFKKKYGKELIGKQMGQFHSDFKVPGTQPVSIESYFLGKKAYIDLLEYKDEKNETQTTHHIRLKGVPTPCIKKHASLHEKSVLDIYDDLYNHKPHSFDLLNRKEIKPYFDRGRTFRHRNRSSFVRKLSF